MIKYSIGVSEILGGSKTYVRRGIPYLEKKSNRREGEDKLGAIGQRGSDQ